MNLEDDRKLVKERCLHDEKAFQIWVIFLQYSHHRVKTVIIHPTSKNLQIGEFCKDGSKRHWVTSINSGNSAGKVSIPIFPQLGIPLSSGAQTVSDLT
jgi:hypothetical protein